MAGRCRELFMRVESEEMEAKEKQQQNNERHKDDYGSYKSKEK
jgi:hypothetical protein